MRNQRLLVVVVLMILTTVGSVRAALILDPESPMTWDDAVACKLVVVGRYDSHQQGVISLKVLRVLRAHSEFRKGAPDSIVKTGDVIAVKLEHWWSVETGPVGFDARQPDAKGDGKPRLCYKAQLKNPGPLVPNPVLERDESAIFFFPEIRGVLKRPLQILPVEQADGWQEALDNQPMNLTFRLAQGLNPKLGQQALEELKTGRDRRIIALLIDTIINGPPPDRSSRGLFQGVQPEQLLIALGDQRGDVYDAVHARIERVGTRPVYPLLEVLGQIDPDRALKDLRSWINASPPHKELRNAAVNALAWVGNEESLDLAIDLIRDKDAGDTAVMAIRMMVGERWWPWPNTSLEQRARLWNHAKQRLTDPNPPANLSQNSQSEYKWLLQKVLTASGPPR